MRIVHYCSKLWPARGGAERQLDRLLDLQLASGHTPVVVTFERGSRTDLEIVELQLGASLRSSIGAVRDAVRTASNGADAVHVHGVGPLAAAAVSGARRARAGVVSGLRSSGENADHLKVEAAHGRLVGGAVWRYQYRVSDLIAVKTRRMRDEIAALGVPTDKLRLVPNGIDISQFAPASSPSMDARSFVYIGRLLEHVKGLDVLADAWRTLADSGTSDGWSLHVYGEGPDSAALQMTLGALPGVEMHGVTDDVAGAVSAGTIVVLPSRVEGFSNTLLEALASGRPVIGTVVSGTEDVVASGAGWLVAPGDAAALAAAMVEAMRMSQPQLEAAGSRARECADRFSIDVVASQWEAVYRELAAHA